MAENNYPIPENPVFNMNIRALQDSDPASASTIFNPLIERLIENLCALKLLLDGKVGADGMQEALTGINNSLSEINTALAGKAAANHGHNAATAQAAGFMAAADKAKLDGVAAGATANTASGATPKALGTATPGSLAGFSRGDHVHPKPSPADIGAAAANHSHTAAQVGALASNGKAATAGTADTAKACSGNAATATKLATARSISVNVGSNIGSNFDGSANIAPGVTGVLPIANGGTGASSAAGARTALGITNVYIASGTFTQDTFTSYTITIGFLAKLFIVVYKTKYNSAETLALWNVPIINPTSGAYVCNLYNTTDGEHTVTFNTNNIVFNKLSRGTYLWLAIG